MRLLFSWMNVFLEFRRLIVRDKRESWNYMGKLSFGEFRRRRSLVRGDVERKAEYRVFFRS